MKNREDSIIRGNPDVAAAWQKLGELFDDVLGHSGFGEIRIEVRWLSKGRKEIIIASGKQYRYVVSNVPTTSVDGPAIKERGKEGVSKTKTEDRS